MDEYRRILVPLDGTPFAEAALRPAAELASRAGGSLHLVTALQQDPGQLVTVEPVPPDELEFVQRTGDLEEYLGEACDRVREEWKCEVSSHILPQEPRADALVRYAEELGADVVVAATHSRGVIARAFLGSTAADLVRGVPCPILLVPSADPAPDPDLTPLQGAVKSVVAALDPEGDPDDGVLAHALIHVDLWNATLQLVQVVMTQAPSALGMPGGPVSGGPGVALVEEHREAAEKRLEGLVSDLRDRGVDAQASVLLGWRAADAVVDFVESGDADLLVVGRHDKEFMERTLMGSESDRLARRIRSAGILICPLDR
jgi:nucleotide-binding universal stress UspA family protein